MKLLALKMWGPFDAYFAKTKLLGVSYARSCFFYLF